MSHWMTDITGSSVVILDAAKTFLERGYEVHVGCVKQAEPMTELLRQAGIHLFVLRELIDPGDYEIIWCQHMTFGMVNIERYLGEVLPTRVVFSHLGPTVPLELPSYPFEKAVASAILCNSPETMQAVVRVQGASGKEIVFHNAAPAHFREARRERSELLRVLMVSNHHVPELSEATQYLREHYNIHVELIGAHTGVYRPVIPFDIAWADTIVTIGKSVVYGLLGGLPIYVYGPHGGEGYLTHDNYERNQFHNFSGRPSCVKKTAREIADEIIRERPAALDFMLVQQTQFDEDYCLDDRLASLLSYLETSEPIRVEPQWIFGHRLYRNVVQSLSLL